MKVPIRLTVVLFTLGLMVACAIASAPLIPPTSGATSTLPAIAPTASMASTMTSSAPIYLSIPTQPHGITAVNNLEPSAPKGELF